VSSRTRSAVDDSTRGRLATQPGLDERQVVRYGEGLFIGYRGYDKTQTDVAFPFGFGLS